MSLRLQLLTAIGLAMIAANPAVARAGEQEPTVQHLLTEARITMVQAIDAATQAVKGGNAYSADLVVNDDDKPEYEVLLLVAGEYVQVDVDAVNGKVVNIQCGEDDEGQEDQITIDQLPPAVQETITAEADGGKIKEIQIAYGASVVRDGEVRHILVAENGALIWETDPDADEQGLADEEGVSLAMMSLSMEPSFHVDWLLYDGAD